MSTDFRLRVERKITAEEYVRRLRARVEDRRMTPDDVIVSRHYLRRRARRVENTDPNRLRVKKTRRGPFRWLVVRRPGA